MIVFLPGVRSSGSELGERTGLNPGSEFGFGERIQPNPGSAGLEFGERNRPNPGLAGSEKRMGQTLALSLQKRQG